jgi:hypothetical protein
MRIKRGGVAIGEAAAFRDRRSFRRHVVSIFLATPQGTTMARGDERGTEPARTGRDPLAGDPHARNTA